MRQLDPNAREWLVIDHSKAPSDWKHKDDAGGERFTLAQAQKIAADKGGPPHAVRHYHTLVDPDAHLKWLNDPKGGARWGP